MFRLKKILVQMKVDVCHLFAEVTGKRRQFHHLKFSFLNPKKHYHHEKESNKAADCHCVFSSGRRRIRIQSKAGSYILC
jgi:hypothetical protein